jgi:hypothetical protein
MRALRILTLFVLLLSSSILVFGKVRVDFDHEVDFSKYRTFMWLEEPQTADPFMANRIVDAVNAHLMVRGLELVGRNADLCITASFATQEVPTYYTYYNGYGGWGGGGLGLGWGRGWAGLGNHDGGL